MGFATGSEEIKNYEIEKTESSKDRDTERFDMEDKNDTDLLIGTVYHNPSHSHRRRRFLALFFVGVAVGMLALTAWAIYFNISQNSEAGSDTDSHLAACSLASRDNCAFSLVESIPIGLTYPPGSPSHMSTFDAWISLLRSSTKTVNIASMYWTLLGKNSGYEDPSDWQGEDVYKEIAATVRRGVKVRIIQTASGYFDDNETEALAAVGAEVRQLNMTRLLGGGVLHTKLWIVDGKHFFTGSANTDWRSLTQVKELSHVTWNCSCAVADVQKVFDVYWVMAVNDSAIPIQFHKDTHTLYNETNRMNLSLNGHQADVYISSSPPAFSPPGRADDLTTILHTINAAQHSVSVAVMDYFPTTKYSYPRSYWAAIDDALRHAAFDRGVRVRLMASLWPSTSADMHQYLLSLAALDGISANSQFNVSIEVRLFVVNATADQRKIPFARVNHNKYLVTDNCAYIGTSNWSKDYFTDTCGVGYVINQTDIIVQKGVPASETVQGQLQAVFDRDWNSPYAELVVRDSIQ